jgi:hypothetical protein
MRFFSSFKITLIRISTVTLIPARFLKQSYHLKVIEYVLKKRLPESIHSEITVGKVNSYLDEMANLRAYANKNSDKGTAHHNHGWRKALQGENDNGGNANSNKEKLPEATLRADWLRRVMSNELSPLEHKWLVRLLQKKVRRPS